MTRPCACLGVVAWLCGAAFAQTGEPAPHFAAADVHTSTGRFLRGPFVGGGRYEIRTATLLDLIRTAYTMDADKIYGGPSWLEFDRFDVIATLPPGSNAESRKTMLQTLLAERFHLVVHNDTKPMAAYALTAGKHSGLKEADPAGEPGCQPEQQRIAPRPAGSDGPMMIAPTFLFTCKNLTMAVFAERLRTMIGVPQYLNNKRVVDQTGLTGAWDFSFKFSLMMRGIAGPPADSVTLFEAVEKQLGLKLEPATAPMPVLVVDSANRTPTENSPEELKSLPAPPTEFDVAEIKPSEAAQNGAAGMNGIVLLNGQPMAIQNGRLIQPVQNGRVNLPGYTLKQLITTAWDLTDDTLAGLPKFAESDKYDVIAKLPATGGPYEGSSDMETVRPLLRALLIEKFKITFHKEERPGNAFVLTAAKPKLKPADPASRTKCQEGPGADGKDPRNANPVLSRLVTCTNVSMAQFAALLPAFAGGYLSSAAVDETGLQGTWDFTLNFSVAGIDRMRMPVQGGGVAGSEGAAADPSGGLSLTDALSKQLGLKLEQQKRPVPVVVFDHVEPKPAE